MRYIQSNLIFYGFTISFHHSKEVFVCCLIVSLRCVFWVGLFIRGGGGIDSPRPASQRAAAFILTAAMLTTLAAPAFAGTWDIEKGDITVKAGETGNDVTQNNETTYGDTGTVITGESKENTVTIDTSEGNVDVTFDDLNIDASSRSEAAVSVTGKGDTNIELDGSNKLQSGRDHAGLEHNQTVGSEGNVTSGKLTIQDDNDKAGSLDATGGRGGAGIGGGMSKDGQATITGGTITANGGKLASGIGGGAGSRIGKIIGSGDVEITGGTITATGNSGGAGIGGGLSGDGNVRISGGTIISAVSDGSDYGGAGIGGGHGGGGHVTITGDATVKEAQGFGGGAGIGSGIYGPIGDVEISGNANVERAIGSDLGAGIGAGYGESGFPNVGKVTIKDNAKIGLAQGGAGAAGIGGGYYESYIPEEDTSSSGVGDVTIEGNTTVNAVGGEGAAGIGGGVNALTVGSNDGNKITIRGNETGTPTVNATGGAALTDEDGNKVGPGGAGIGSGAGDAKANITLEGKVTITATAGKDNVAIGDKNGEQEFNGLAEGSSITRYDSKGNGITLPTDPGHPVPAPVPAPASPSSSGGGSAGASVQESVFPGLVVTDKDGQRISYTSTQSGNTLTVCVGRFTASLRISLAALRQLRAEGIETITFQTILCSTTLSVDELLAMGGEDAEIVLAHHIRSSTLTVGGKAV